VQENPLRQPVLDNVEKGLRRYMCVVPVEPMFARRFLEEKVASRFGCNRLLLAHDYFKIQEIPSLLLGFAR
jgi:hypothetical protein